MEVGLAVAVGTGLIELAVAWYREKKLEKFVLLDTLLLVALSGLSWLFEDEIFFKVKPAMIDLVLLALVSLSLFTRLDPLGAMTQRYLQGMELALEQKRLFRRNLLVMWWMVFVHTILVLLTAFFASKEVWAFVSTFLLFIMMGAFLGFELLKRRFFPSAPAVTSDAEEWLPVVDEEGRILGKASRSLCHRGSRILHPVVHLHLLDKAGSIFLQKRAMTKLVQPGKWDTAVGGHIAFGESLEDSLKREASEEIGLRDFTAAPVLRYRWDSEIESELVYSFVTRDGKANASVNDEITEGRFWKIPEIEKSLGKGIFTPNFEHEYLLLKKSGYLAKNR